MARLVVSNAQGEIFELPEFEMVGMNLDRCLRPAPSELIPLPYGSDLFQLPGRIALGYHPASDKVVPVKEYQGERVFPVAAFMAPAHLQFLRAAYRTPAGAPRLSLYAYTAVGWEDGEFVVPATRIDADIRQDPAHVNLRLVDNEARRLLRRYPNNRLAAHLIENCVFRYGCPAARNFTLGRFELPLPASPGCNAACVGCISEQPRESQVTPPQERITFTPTPEEIAEIAVPHLETAPAAVVSFGQGCEGEPLLVADVLAEAIALIRKRTCRGVINLNTNGSDPAAVERLCQAGLDSIRVSMNSAQEACYHAYYRPRHYSFQDVVESLRVVRRYGRWASINYFVFPGLTDHPEEMAALARLVETTGLNMVQTRNLNIDPDWYMEVLNLRSMPGEPTGIPAWLRWLGQSYPQVRLGYFNPPREVIQQSLAPPANSAKAVGSSR